MKRTCPRIITLQHLQELPYGEVSALYGFNFETHLIFIGGLYMWNDGEGLSIRCKKLLIYVASVFLTVLLFYITYEFIIPKDSEDIEIYISAVAVILTLVGYILSITNSLISQQMDTDLVLTLDVETKESRAIITCAIENKGMNRINNMEFYMFIDQPVLDTDIGIYQANHVLKHDCTHKYNCKFSLLCKNGEINEYPEEFKIQESEDAYYGVKKLDFLSPESVLYVNPGERFSEDVVVKLKQGVYRVLIIGIFGKKRNGCSCANKQFIIGLDE